MSKFDALKARVDKSICNSYGRYPVALANGQGSRVFDLDGRAYVDLLSGIAVTALGHRHPELVQVIKERAEGLLHTSNVFYLPEQAELAERLLATSHAGKVFFCNSGAEANEAAFKLARRYMRKVKGREAFEIITLENSFHGRTLAAITATGQPKFQDGFQPLPGGFKCVPWGDIEALTAAVTPQTAAIMIEVVQGEGGVRPMTEAYATAIRDLCKAKDILLMIDEVQTGLCRTGRFWAFQRYGLEPDVFTAAKALAGGLPMGAMFATDEVAAGFVPGTHASTFGGGPLICSVASKVAEIMVRDDLAGRAERLGAFAVDLFKRIQADLPGKIEEIRGQGLLLGIVLTQPGQAVWRGLLDDGFILNLTQDRVLRLLPPLIIEEKDLWDFAQALRRRLEAA